MNSKQYGLHESSHSQPVRTDLSLGLGTSPDVQAEILKYREGAAHGRKSTLRHSMPTFLQTYVDAGDRDSVADFGPQSERQVRLNRNCGHGPYLLALHKAIRPATGKVAPCPVCAKLMATTKTFDALASPAVRSEWNHELNAKVGLFPDQVLARSDRKAWFTCSSPLCGAYYQARIANRTHPDRPPTSCPLCAKSGRLSKDHAYLFCELKGLGLQVEIEKEYGYPGHSWAADICISNLASLPVMIELDGIWHSEARTRHRDEEVTKFAEGRFHLIRVRNTKLEKIRSSDIEWNSWEKPLPLIHRIIREGLVPLAIEAEVIERLERYVNEGELKNTEEAVQLFLHRHSAGGEKSLRSMKPKAADDFDYARRFHGKSIRVADDISANAAVEVPFKCTGCDHEYSRVIYSAARLSGDPCPKCNERVTTSDEKLLCNAHPDLFLMLKQSQLEGLNKGIELDAIRVTSPMRVTVVCNDCGNSKTTELRVLAGRISKSSPDSRKSWCTCKNPQRVIGDLDARLAALYIGNKTDRIGRANSPPTFWRCSGDAGLGSKHEQCLGEVTRLAKNVASSYQHFQMLPTCGPCHRMRANQRPSRAESDDVGPGHGQALRSRRGP